MNLYLLDTDTLSLLQEAHPRLLQQVAARKPEELAIAVITVEEQMSGWYRRLRRAKEPSELARIYDRLTRTTSSLARLRILSFSETAILHMRVLQSQKLNVRRMDLGIAAIALEHKAIVVTRNVRDFKRVPGLPVENWSDQP